MIFFTSDTHFCHDKPFIYEARGYKNVQEMNEDIIKKWNSVVSTNDTVFHLGDVMLGKDAVGISCLNRLNGHIHIIAGNHDTASRIKLYSKQPNVEEVSFCQRWKYDGKEIWLSHYPLCLANQNEYCRYYNFFGHTHQTSAITEDNFINSYNVGMDAHNCCPISIDQIFKEMNIRKD